MVSSEFQHASEKLSRRLGELNEMMKAAELTPAAQPPANPKPLATTTHTSPDGHIEVIIADGRLEDLVVDTEWFADSHPRTAWKAIRQVINEALELNNEQLLVELRKIDVGVETVQRLVEETTNDFTTAFRNLLDRA